MPIRSQLLDVVRNGLRPLTSGRLNYESLLQRMGETHFVLIGEASHGTHEFYKHRAEITKRLIEEKNFMLSPPKPTGPMLTASIVMCAAGTRTKHLAASLVSLLGYGVTMLLRNSSAGYGPTTLDSTPLTRQDSTGSTSTA